MHLIFKPFEFHVSSNYCCDGSAPGLESTCSELNCLDWVQKGSHLPKMASQLKTKAWVQKSSQHLSHSEARWWKHHNGFLLLNGGTNRDTLNKNQFHGALDLQTGSKVPLQNDNDPKNSEELTGGGGGGGAQEPLCRQSGIRLGLRETRKWLHQWSPSSWTEFEKTYKKKE